MTLFMIHDHVVQDIFKSRYITINHSIWCFITSCSMNVFRELMDDFIVGAVSGTLRISCSNRHVLPVF
jgi:hypothetical protein